MLNPYYDPYWIQDDFLEHHGVKGQRWGVRRYQNADGTLTEAGKKRLKKYTNAANYYAWKAAKYDTKAEVRMRKAEAKGKVKTTGHASLAQLLSASDAMTADSYRQNARQLIDAIYPEMRDIPWSDAEKKILYTDIMNWKMPAWAKKYHTQNL